MTHKDDICMKRNGFALFLCDDGKVRLQKLDDPIGINEDIDDWLGITVGSFGDPSGEYKIPKFKSDKAAAKYVQKNADKEEGICREVIEHLIEIDSPSVEEFKLRVNW